VLGAFVAPSTLARAAAPQRHPWRSPRGGRGAPPRHARPRGSDELDLAPAPAGVTGPPPRLGTAW